MLITMPLADIADMVATDTEFRLVSLLMSISSSLIWLPFINMKSHYVYIEGQRFLWDTFELVRDAIFLLVML